MSYDKRVAKARPTVERILQECENDGFSYEEMTTLCHELKQAVSKRQRGLLSLPFTAGSGEE